MEKINHTQRIKEILQDDSDTKYFILRDGRYWKEGDHGYSDNVKEAKVFTQADILARLDAHGLMDKEIRKISSTQ